MDAAETAAPPAGGSHESRKSPVNVARIECASCPWASGVGALIGDVVAEPGPIARTAARHLQVCPRRHKAHPAFGFEPRWTSYVLGDGSEVLRVWWGCAGEGSFPFNIEAALADG